MYILTRSLLIAVLAVAWPAWVAGCQSHDRDVNVEVQKENGKVEEVEVQKENGRVTEVEVEREGPVERGLETAGEAVQEAGEAAVKGTGKGIEKAGEGMNRAGEWMQEKAD